METSELRDLFKTAVTGGQPVRRRLMSAVEQLETTLHPLFELMELSDPSHDYDPGYTGNPHRGEHLTIPCLSEQGVLFTIEVSFHKGTTFVDVVRFDGVDPAAVEALEEGLYGGGEWEADEGRSWESAVSPPREPKRVRVDDAVPVPMSDRLDERSIHEVLELAEAAEAAIEAFRRALVGVRPRIELKGLSYEAGAARDEFFFETRLLGHVAQVLEGDMPLAAQFPDGGPAEGVLSPRQLAYLASLAPEATRTVRYSELLAATSELPRLEQDMVDRVKEQEEVDRRMGVTCPRCGSGPGESCRTIGGKSPGSETEMHAARGR